jgi:protein phosphatase
MPTISVALSDVGRRRAHNEDAYLCDDLLGFYVVADGVGGHAKGEVASREAIEQLQMWMRGASRDLLKLSEQVAGGNHDARWDIRRLLEGGVQSACYMVYGMAEIDPDKKGMSTTMSAVLVMGGFCYAAHVGDSRVYRVRGAEVLQITEDHTMINYKLKRGLITREEAQNAVGKNIITRAVGHKEFVQIDTADIDVLPGDRLLLCTDGLHGHLESETEVVDLIGSGPLSEGVAAAIALANQRGGYDNITAIALQVTDGN